VKLTIGLPCFGAYYEAALTLQALRLGHDLRDVELIVVDNGEDRALERLAGAVGARYVREEKRGPAHAKDRVFREARGAWTLCIDSHVVLWPGAVAALIRYGEENPASVDVLHGPLVMDDGTLIDRMENTWGTDKKVGVWAGYRSQESLPLDAAPFDIPMHGCGLFALRTGVWCGFPEAWRGFACEEPWVAERVRRWGGRVLLHPALRWWHLFRQAEHPGPHAPLVADLARNFHIAYRELKWDPAPVVERYGPPPADL
jgi:glycosyltransferase involved in cell wall biosynthesis